MLSSGIIRNVEQTIDLSKFKAVNAEHAAETVSSKYAFIPITEGERQAFAATAIELRWNGEEFAVNPQSVIRPRRTAERAPTLWNTYTVTQEAVIRGGVMQRDVRNGSKTYGRSTRRRKIGGLDENIWLNRALWRLTEEMAKLKS